LEMAEVVGIPQARDEHGVVLPDLAWRDGDGRHHGNGVKVALAVAPDGHRVAEGDVDDAAGGHAGAPKAVAMRSMSSPPRVACQRVIAFSMLLAVSGAFSEASMVSAAVSASAAMRPCVTVPCRYPFQASRMST